jgi:hypothetical protein
VVVCRGARKKIEESNGERDLGFREWTVSSMWCECERERAEGVWVGRIADREAQEQMSGVYRGAAAGRGRPFARGTGRRAQAPLLT